MEVKMLNIKRGRFHVAIASHNFTCWGWGLRVFHFQAVAK
jgi:hypothetical protein